jgi:outer membrane protein assembly factor BamE
MPKVLFILLLLAGCQYVPSIPGLSAHKVDIQQGNYITQDMVDKLKPGMSRSQVRFALGTPLVVDPFHTDRWDYIYVNQRKGRVVAQRRIIVVFQDDKLLRIEGEGAAPKATSATPDTAASKPAAPATPPADRAKPADAQAPAQSP